METSHLVGHFLNQAQINTGSSVSGLVCNGDGDLISVPCKAVAGPVMPWNFLTRTFERLSEKLQGREKNFPSKEARQVFRFSQDERERRYTEWHVRQDF